MMMNKLINPALKGVFQQPVFFFSAKKKQMELTLRTPYSNPQLTQKPSSRTSPASADSSPRISAQWWSSKIDPHPPCTSSPPAPSGSDSMATSKELRTSTFIPADGQSSTRSIVSDSVTTLSKST